MNVSRNSKRSRRAPHRRLTSSRSQPHEVISISDGHDNNVVEGEENMSETTDFETVQVIENVAEQAIKSPDGTMKLSECASQTTPGLIRNRQLELKDEIADVAQISTDDKKDDSMNDEQYCPICFEMWTNSGPHRIVSLTCGHLFGRSCIERWLKDQKNKCCPQCKSKALHKDIRNIFAKSLVALDTTEKEQVKKELLEEKYKRSKAEEAEAKAILQCQLLKAEMEQLKKSMLTHEPSTSKCSTTTTNRQPTASTPVHSITMTTRRQANQNNGPNIRSLRKSYQFQRELQVSQKDARVMCYDNLHMTLVVSKPSPNQLFKGFGVLKVSSLENRSSQYISIHQGVIRDAKFNSSGDQLLLTASVDKCLKLTSIHSNATVQSYTCPAPVWACAWNKSNTNIVYAGLQNGSCYVYDIRQTNNHLTAVRPRVGVGCPIVSLAYIPPGDANSKLSCEGVLVGTINGGWLIQNTANSFIDHQLLLPDGACSGLYFDENTRHCLLSQRPGKKSTRIIHNVCELLGNCSPGNPVHAKVLQRCFGGSRAQSLNRSYLFTCPDLPSRLMVASGDEASSSLMVWDGGNGTELQNLPCSGGCVFDTLAFEAYGSHFLAALSEQKLRFYQWQ